LKGALATDDSVELGPETNAAMPALHDERALIGLGDPAGDPDGQTLGDGGDEVLAHAFLLDGETWTVAHYPDVGPESWPPSQ